MDLISVLTQALGTDPARAQAVAGGLLGAVQSAVGQRAGPAVAAQLDAAVPEAAEWQGASAQLLGGEGSGAIGALASALGGGGAPTQGLIGFSQLLQQLGLDPAKALALGSVLLGFLQSRLSPELMAKVTSALPMLSGLGGAAGGGLFGALGGMLGGAGAAPGGAGAAAGGLGGALGGLGGALGGLGGLFGGGGSAGGSSGQDN